MKKHTLTIRQLGVSDRKVEWVERSVKIKFKIVKVKSFNIGLTKEVCIDVWGDGPEGYGRFIEYGIQIGSTFLRIVKIVEFY